MANIKIGQKNIFIIGTGAIGTALAVFLSLAGRPVRLVRGSVNGVGTLVHRFRVEMEGEAFCEADVEVTALDSLGDIDGIVVLASKSFGNENLAITLRKKVHNSPVVLLQNGLGVERSFLDHGYPHVYRCVLFVTSQQIGPSAVCFKPVATSPIGIERGDSAHLQAVVNQLDTPDFRFESAHQIQSVIWKKAIINCVFNSVCPLLDIDNGIFHRNSDALALARRVIAECLVVAEANGVTLRLCDIENSLLKISRVSEGQAISTLQDIRSRRRTEIDTLNPEIVRIAAQLELQNAVPETRLLGELIRIKSELARH